MRRRGDIAALIDFHLTQFRVNIAFMTQYRLELTFWALGIIMEPLIYMAVWDTVTRQQGMVGGLSGGEFSAYYITWMVVRQFVLSFDSYLVAHQIRTGQLSTRLILPIHPIHADFGYNLAFQFVSLPIVAAAILLLVVLFPPVFDVQPWQIAAFIPAVLLAYPVRFLGAWILGLIAFWITEAGAIFMAYGTFEVFLSGRIAPLTLFPDWMLIAASVLPFRWMLSFPVEIMLGLVSPQQVMQGYAMQLLWLCIMVVLLRLVWRSGIRRYSAVGA